MDTGSVNNAAHSNKHKETNPSSDGDNSSVQEGDEVLLEKIKKIDP